jgi:hypothetical protein
MQILALVLASTVAGPHQTRIDADVAAGRPVVVHVVVALCDAKRQGVVPPANETLCQGDNPRQNLYWGALYGVKTHLSRKGWEVVSSADPPGDEVVQRVVFKRQVPRGQGRASVYVVADAYHGAHIRKATEVFLDYAAGRHTVDVAPSLAAGGAAHVITYVGHNGLMDFELPATKVGKPEPARVAVALACASDPYFGDRLRTAGAGRLLLTSSLMAPEAYTLEAALLAWVAGQKPAEVHEAAARAYHKYQKCGLKAARRLFVQEPESLK